MKNYLHDASHSKKQWLVVLFSCVFLVALSSACSDSGEMPIGDSEITQDSAAIQEEIKKLEKEAIELDEIQSDIDQKEKELNELLEGL